MSNYSERELEEIRERCPVYKRIGCCGEKLLEGYPRIECNDNETCQASTK